MMSVTTGSPHPSPFEKELEDLINRHSQENASNTPDFIVARYLFRCLHAWNAGVQEREAWYGRPAHDIATVPVDGPNTPPPGKDEY
jgi:hypothetical protein